MADKDKKDIVVSIKHDSLITDDGGAVFRHVDAALAALSNIPALAPYARPLRALNALGAETVPDRKKIVAAKIKELRTRINELETKNENKDELDLLRAQLDACIEMLVN